MGLSFYIGNFVVSPDGSNLTDLPLSAGPQLARSNAHAALPESTTPVSIGRPAPGDRIQGDLDATPNLRLAVDLSGAQVQVEGDRIVITLPDGGVVVLTSSMAQQFLAGAPITLDRFLSAAAGSGEMGRASWRE